MNGGQVSEPTVTRYSMEIDGTDGDYWVEEVEHAAGRHMRYIDLAPLLQAAREQGWREGAEAGFRRALSVCEAEPEREKDFQDIWQVAGVEQALAALKEKHHA